MAYPTNALMACRMTLSSLVVAARRTLTMEPLFCSPNRDQVLPTIRRPVRLRYVVPAWSVFTKHGWSVLGERQQSISRTATDNHVGARSGEVADG
jgi:hypothetical protein